MHCEKAEMLNGETTKHKVQSRKQFRYRVFQLFVFRFLILIMQRIFPFQSRKTREVNVRGQIARRADLFQQGRLGLKMRFRRMNQINVWQGKQSSTRPTAASTVMGR
jgi:hypothetical protein